MPHKKYDLHPKKVLTNTRNGCKITDVRQSTKALTKGGRNVDEMTAQELNAFLENIAKLIEATLENKEAAQEAAKIVRDSKVKA